MYSIAWSGGIRVKLAVLSCVSIKTFLQSLRPIVVLSLALNAWKTKCCHDALSGLWWDWAARLAVWSKWWNPPPWRNRTPWQPSHLANPGPNCEWDCDLIQRVLQMDVCSKSAASFTYTFCRLLSLLDCPISPLPLCHLDWTDYNSL